MSTHVEPQPASTREWQWGWAVVFVANLPVALFFGFLITSPEGAFGMCAAVALMWLAGHFYVARALPGHAALVVGSGLLAPTQAFPLLQIVAGALAVAAVGNQSQDLTAPEAFAVTLLTGAQFAVAVLVCGGALGLFGRLIEGRLARGPA